MWVRKQIEISPVELIAALGECLRGGDWTELEARVRRDWGDDSWVALSVRSGFDLLLSELNYPPGSEILMSGMTIPDMPRIVVEHGLRPVGVDVEFPNFAPNLDAIQRRITPATRAIVVAHLFGGLCDMGPVIELAARYGLLVIEDCAQAYIGSAYQGDPRADVSMFSFGPIKTNTSLAGAVFKVRRPELLAKLQVAHQRWPQQTRRSYAARVLKYALVRTLSFRPITSLIALTMRAIGRDHDRLAVRLSRGFPGPDFFRRIRRRPSVALLRVMDRKFRRFQPETIVERTGRGTRIAAALEPRIDVVGSKMQRPTFWVLPVLVEDPASLVRTLWRSGFDGTASSSLRPIPAADGQPDPQLETTARLLKHIVYLPFDLNIPQRELDRLVAVVLASGARRAKTIVPTGAAPRATSPTPAARSAPSPAAVEPVSHA
jgi:dTDP-4-amino-4,6-dideoxygalactose transaminase